VLISIVSIISIVSTFPSFAFADQLEPEGLNSDIRSFLEDPLPSLSSVLPGYSRPLKQVPTLVVADLTSEHEDTMPWGSALGRILRRKIMFAPTMLLRMPDLDRLRDDAWKYGMPERDVLRSLESLNLISQRLGIRNALTGDIKIEEPRFTLELSLLKLPDGKVYKSLHYSGDVEHLPETLSIASIEIYKSLGLRIDQKTRDYLLNKNPITFNDIKDFANILLEIRNKPKGEAFAIVKKFMDKGFHLPAAASLYLYYMEPDKDLHTYLKRLDGVAASFPEDVGIELTVASYMGYKDAPDLVKEKIRRFQKIIRENPNDPSARIKFSTFLANCGYTLPALAVCMETLERWPDQYRAWWNISYVLLEYAWQLRGIKFWDDVPEKGKKMFYPLKDLSTKAVDKALTYNHDNADLWVLKMRTIAGYTPELLDCFRRAIKLDPHNSNAYAMALNFSLPQWGGSYEAQEEVWTLAKKNNPGQPWLQEIREKYMKEPPFTYKMKKLLFPNTNATSILQYIFLFIEAVTVLIVLFLLLRWRRNRSPEDMQCKFSLKKDPWWKWILTYVLTIIFGSFLFSATWGGVNGLLTAARLVTDPSVMSEMMKIIGKEDIEILSDAKRDATGKFSPEKMAAIENLFKKHFKKINWLPVHITVNFITFSILGFLVGIILRDFLLSGIIPLSLLLITLPVLNADAFMVETRTLTIIIGLTTQIITVYLFALFGCQLRAKISGRKAALTQ
jgi:tetratricopeptide (TPR) repeat protein